MTPIKLGMIALAAALLGRPVPAHDSSVDGAEVNAVPLAQFGLGDTLSHQRADVAHNGSVEFFPTARPTLALSVGGVVSSRAGKEVPGVAARRVVATVTNAETSHVNTSAGQSKSACNPVHIANRKTAVSVRFSAALKGPALIEATDVDLAPETCDCFLIHETPLVGRASGVSAPRGHSVWRVT